MHHFFESESIKIENIKIEEIQLISNFLNSFNYNYPDNILLINTSNKIEKWIEYLTKKRKAENDIFKVTNLINNQLIGMIELEIFTKNKLGKLSFIFEKSYWHKEFITNGLNDIIFYGFNKLNLNKIYAEHLTHDFLSEILLIKLNMKYEGTLKAHLKFSHQYLDIDFRSILMDEWMEENANTK